MSTSSPPASTTFAEAALAAELGEQTGLLRALVAQERAEILQLVVGNFAFREMIMQKSPVSGARRVLVRRYGQGADAFAVTTTPQLCLAASEGRMGGRIVNTGAVAVFCYLCPIGDAPTATGGNRGGRPTVWLAPSGGAWDFLLGNTLYGGDVCVATPSTTSTISIAEF